MVEGRSGSDVTTNRLAGESSPYLRLHQHNPVDWYPWGAEALERARREDKPIFLSVGYSTCFWCHVMERESFSDAAIAERMNRDFVNIKLDREERPDLDEIYMAATQILSGHGGWPNSVFLTPELKPFYAGTYFPPDDRHGRPGFPSVLSGLAESWAGRRADVIEQAEEMARAMRHYLEERAQPSGVPPGPAAAERAVESLARRFDREHGGFGDAPKFPTPANLLLLLEVAHDAAGEEAEAGAMLAATLDAMARGGIYDQLGGGFHRYATDREWRVPHFEKMLYDNGLLLEVYAREHGRSGDAEAARIVRETAAFLGREMTAPGGAFWSAIDAETAGDEGAFYVWKRDEIEAVLGDEEAAFLAPILGFAGPPFFEGGRYVLHLPRPLAELAQARRLEPAALAAEVRALADHLLAARGRRPRPATDDKILTDWNGTAITGLAVAGELLGDPELTARAARAADFLLTHLRPAPEGAAAGARGPLRHAWRDGEAKIPAFAADYAFLVRGLLALHRATGEERWAAAAAELSREQIARLRDPQGGCFVAAESPDLLFRSHDVFDGALPAAEAITVLNLVDLAALEVGGDWLAEARAALQAFAPLVERHPDAVRTLALAARRYHQVAGGAEDSIDERGPDAGLRLVQEEAEEVVRVGLQLGEVGEDGFRPFTLALAVAPGWHLNANPASEPFLVPTTVSGQGLELRNVAYPAGEPLRMSFEEKPLASYAGRVELTGELRGSGALALVYQPCDATRCLPPIEREIGIG